MAEAKKTSKTKKQAELVAETVVEGEAPEAVAEVTKETKPTAKAGKRSAKAVKETEEKQAKEERKAEAPVDKPKKPAPKARTRLERAGKKYREVAKLIEKDKAYSLAEALELATKTNPAKFDASVEMHIRLGVDPRQASQNIRDMVTLPAGTGKTVRIAAFVDGDDVAKAKTAGADIVGADAITALLDKEELGFDVLVATPTLMAKLGKYAKLLGPKGLMPNPKSGTVTADVATAIKEAKAGRVEYRVDPTGIVHLSIGKVSFGPEKLLQNAEAVMASIRAAKPAGIKGSYILSQTVATTMGPAIKIETSSRG